VAHLPYFTAPDPPVPASRFTLDCQVGKYLTDRKVTVYYHDSGNVAVPVAAADGAAQEIIKQKAACGYKVVSFVVERFGLMPLVPGMEVGDPNSVYLRGRLWVDAPAINLDGGSYIYHVEGFYVYALKNPVWVNTAPGVPIGAKVTDRTDPRQNVIPVQAFIDPSGIKGGYSAPGDNLNIIVTQLKPKPPAMPTRNSIADKTLTLVPG
jgi:hypothetical protein